MTILTLTTLFVIVATLIMADLLADTGYTVRCCKRVWELFAFAVFVIGLAVYCIWCWMRAVYCIWCWMRGKQPTNIFN